MSRRLADVSIGTLAVFAGDVILVIGWEWERRFVQPPAFSTNFGIAIFEDLPVLVTVVNVQNNGIVVVLLLVRVVRFVRVGLLSLVVVSFSNLRWLLSCHEYVVRK